MQKRRILGGLIALVCTLAVTLGMATVGIVSVQADEDSTPWTETGSLPTAAGTYTLSGDVTMSSTWNVPTGGVTLKLAGHSITGSAATAISIASGARLTIEDASGAGKVTGTATGIDVLQGGALSLKGGSVIGGEKCVSVANGATLSVSGAPKVVGAKAGVYLNNATIAVDGRLENGARISVTKTDASGAVSKDAFTSGYKGKANTEEPGTFFASDNTAYTVLRTQDGNEVRLGTADESKTEVTTNGVSTPDTIKTMEGETYKVTPLASAEGDAGGRVSASLAEGTTGTKVTLTATPNAGSSFDRWEITSGTGATIESATSTTTTLTIGSSDVTVKGTFKEGAAAAYKVSVAASSTGSSSGRVSASLAEGATGTQVTLTATPDAGSAFDRWEVTSGTGATILDSSSATTALTIGTSDVAVTGFFKEEAPETIYATVTFDANGGEGAMDPQTFEQGVAARLNQNTYTREGYAFDGWNTQADGSGKPIMDGVSVRVSRDLTLYAQWTAAGPADTYKVTVKADAAGASGGRVSANPSEGATGTKVTLTATPDDGSELDRWEVTSGTGATIESATSATTTLTIGSSDVTVTAHFKEADPIVVSNVIVTFDANGGEGAMDPQTFTKNETGKLNANAFTRSGYTFGGWNTKADGSGTPIKDGASVKVSRDVTLYAQWTAAEPSTTYKVTVKADAAGASGGRVSANPSEGATGTKVTLTATPDAGSELDRWEVISGTGATIEDPAKTSTTLTIGSSDVTVTAHFKEAGTCVVTFDANGGTGMMSPQTFTKDVATKLNANAFTRSGYTFSGWNTKADGTGTPIKDGANVRVTKNLTLYAQWTAGSDSDKVTVTFNANGGTGTMSPQTFTKGETGKLNTNTFTRSGYTFSGWNTKADGSGTSIKDGANVKVSNNITLYAQWTSGGGQAGTYTVTVKASATGGTSGGKVSASLKQGSTGTQVTLTATPDAGSAFVRWEITSGVGATIEKTTSATTTLTIGTSDVTVTAYFKQEGYAVVSFDPNGGTGSMSPLSVEVGTTTTLSPNTFTRSGYTFSGWNTKADGSGTSIKDGAKVNVKGDITLYAQWKTGTDTSTDTDSSKSSDPYAPVVSNSRGGTLTSTSTEVTYTIKQKVPSDATSLRIWTDLDPAMYFTSGADEVTVKTAAGRELEGMVTLDGQRLTVTIDNASELRGDTITITYKAKVRDGADLSAYLTSSGSFYEIPYKAYTEVVGDSTRTYASEEEVVKFAAGSSTGTTRTTGTTTTGTRTTTTPTTATRTTTTPSTATRTTTTKPSTLAGTGDATILAPLMAIAISGAGLAFVGARKRN